MNKEKEYSLMVVDDEQPAREHLMKDIAWEKLQVKTLYEAGDGLEALKKIREENVDILIMDIRMPGMDGLELLSAIGELDRKPQVIALSGYSDFSAARAMLSSGLVVDYLLKPASGDALFEAVYRCIDRLEEKQRISELEFDLNQTRAALRRLEAGDEEGAAEAEPREGTSGSKAALVRDVKQYLAEHYAEHVTLEDAAGVACIHPTYLSRIFSEVEGAGFSDYLAALRIRKATEYLRDYRLRIYEISEMVGYRNVKHFMKVFKKIEGKTPSEYRENLLLQ